MAQSNTQQTSVFSQTNRGSHPITPGSMNRSEWWLNVNYAEIIEIKDAVGINSLRSRLAG